MDVLKEFKELIAFYHWFSNILALFTAISDNGVTGGVILWLISGFVSALIIEVIRTNIPSYLRPIFKYLSD